VHRLEKAGDVKLLDVNENGNELGKLTAWRGGTRIVKKVKYIWNGGKVASKKSIWNGGNRQPFQIEEVHWNGGKVTFSRS
jgi:hypothetical protein